MVQNSKSEASEIKKEQTILHISSEFSSPRRRRRRRPIGEYLGRAAKRRADGDGIGPNPGAAPAAKTSSQPEGGKQEEQETSTDRNTKKNTAPPTLAMLDTQPPGKKNSHRPSTTTSVKGIQHICPEKTSTYGTALRLRWPGIYPE